MSTALAPAAGSGGAPSGREVLVPAGLCVLDAQGSAPVELVYPGPVLLLVAGLPGAGKSTLLRSLAVPVGVPVLDPEQVAARLRARLPWLRRVPYRPYRPLVHGLHYLGVARALRAGRSLVVHEPGARTLPRRALVRAAARRGITAHLLVVVASARQAREGQRRRGRQVRAARFARHVRSWRRLGDSLTVHGWPGSPLRAEGFGTCVVVPRAATGRLAALSFSAATAPSPPP